MANALDLALQSNQAGMGKGRVGAPPATPGQIGVRVKAAIFFDGTGNNQFNITGRRRDPSYGKPGWLESASSRESYAQSYSNVALLFFMHKKTTATSVSCRCTCRVLALPTGKPTTRRARGLVPALPG